MKKNYFLLILSVAMFLTTSLFGQSGNKDKPSNDTISKNLSIIDILLLQNGQPSVADDNLDNGTLRSGEKPSGTTVVDSAVVYNADSTKKSVRTFQKESDNTTIIENRYQNSETNHLGERTVITTDHTGRIIHSKEYILRQEGNEEIATAYKEVFYTYNEAGLINQIESYSLENDTSAKDHMENISYNEDGYINLIKYYTIGNDSKWLLTEELKAECSTDETGLVSYIEYLRRMDKENVWSNWNKYCKEVYKLDENSNIILWELYKWNEESGEWFTQGREVTIYNGKQGQSGDNEIASRSKSKSADDNVVKVETFGYQTYGGTQIPVLNQYVVYHYSANESLASNDVLAAITEGDVSLVNGSLSINTPVAETVSIYNVLGMRIYSAEKPKGEFNINAKELPQGILLVKGASGWSRKVMN
ncbi:hypothetical protein M2132_001193 [Dysgonomonas sp. PH5-45]|uniref:hypothetical protein n=1 Tax=unclassified Dysgonomonas TaxID=2630389 RepID=UPI002473FF8A|nr:MULTISPECIES: hypothetical protein [unclassified Dysgonomonas]MDH6354860.1 hypothetical protein [Dysgonomonas sp. PH5-45]MDH6387759.1 hypothetical protein [Dysgonomonas sp. PH5-37]